MRAHDGADERAGARHRASRRCSTRRPRRRAARRHAAAGERGAARAAGRQRAAARPFGQRQVDAVPLLRRHLALRAAATCTMPDNAMFIPQRPYVPDGSLRDALAYPNPAARLQRRRSCAQALDDALLPDLAGRLDDSDAWSQKLSGGEQQRLAIARVLLQEAGVAVRRRSHQRARRRRPRKRLYKRLRRWRAGRRRRDGVDRAPRLGRRLPRQALDAGAAAPKARRRALHGSRPRSAPSPARAIRRPGSCRSRSPRRGAASRSPR